MLTSLACLNHSLRVLFHEWPVRAQLEHFLRNPLLVATCPKRLDATREAMGGYTDKRCLQALIALKSERDRMRHRLAVPADVLPASKLTDLFYHELITDAERNRLRTNCWHPLERQWEYARVEQVLQAREAAMYEQDQYAA
ncbi:hypothetical protein HER32_11830 [Hymenobacter sp. BT18]|uniref:hypothetical protein n=1 Tax=Hymenobacter sp. BT18 TaxID=2835648 RepID=UPI00143E2FF9|nr:hypothetical protein [Hymenobacter sp. BT18]QIX61831.1 hypothetical protein HER32_11830 [Hymenobacter sp. BT18]